MGLPGTVDTNNDRTETTEIHGKAAITIILASPLCWPTKKLCEFYEKSQEATNTSNNSAQFLDNFNLKSNLHVLCYPQKDWSSVLKERLNTEDNKLGDKYFEILIWKYTKGKKEKNPLRHDPTKASDIHDKIRHKSVHAKDLDDAAKDILPWYGKDESGQVVFLKKHYMDAWTKWFPLFQIYTWWKYQIFKSELISFYPNWLPPLLNEASFDFSLSSIAQQVDKALLEQVDEGRLVARYEWQDAKTSVLEFRILEDDTVSLILGNSTAIEIEISNCEFKTSWYSKQIKEETRVTLLRDMDGQYSASFIFCDKLNAAVLEILRSMLQTTGHNRLVIFTPESYELNTQLRSTFRRSITDFVESIGCNIMPSEKPVQWHDVSESVQSVVLEKGKVLLQGKVVQLNSVLQTDLLVSKLHLLCGDLLNCILRKLKQVAVEHAEIFDSCTLPAVRRSMLPRRLTYSANVTLDLFFMEDFDKDVFYIERSEKLAEETEGFVTASSQVVLVDDIHNPYEKIIRNIASMDSASLIISTPRTYHELFARSCAQTLYLVSRCILKPEARYSHAFKYLENYMFQLVATSMPYSQFDRELLNLHEDGCIRVEVTEEVDFTERFKDESMIYISGKSGSGKSVVLSRLARRLSEQPWPDRKCLVIFANLQRFATILSHDHEKVDDVSLETVIRAICEISCKLPFEEELLQVWLNDGVGETDRIEFMFDGLDEVSYELREWAYKAWALIRESLPVIRIWVTSKDHLVDTMALSFQCFPHTLDSLRQNEKLELFVNHWKGYIGRNNMHVSAGNIFNEASHDEKLFQFAHLCLHTGESCGLVDTPLGCQLIAELNETMLDTMETPVDLNKTAVTFYNMVVQRRFEGFLNNSPLADIIRDELTEKLEIGYMYHALRSVFSHYFTKDVMSCSFTMKNSKARIDEILLRIGILESNERFFHKTFADFFVARWFCKVINEEFAHVRITDTYIQTFIYNEMIVISKEFKALPDLRHPTLCGYLNEMLTDYVNGKAALKSVLEQTLTSLHKSLGAEKEVTESAFNIFMAAEKYPNIQVFIASLPKYILPLCLEAIIFGEFELFEFVMNEEFCTLWNDLSKTIPLLFGTVDSPKTGLRQLLLEHIFNPDGILAVLEKDVSLIEKRDEQGRTPLLRLAQLAHYSGNGAPCEFAKLVVEIFDHNNVKGIEHVNINAVDCEGNSVLHVNLAKKYEVIFQVNPIHYYLNLLNDLYPKKYFNKGLVNLKNGKGHTPLMTVVRYYGEAENVECAFVIYKNYGYDFSIADDNGDTILHYVIAQGLHKRLMKELLRWGSKVSTVNAKGQTALHVAVEKGDVEVVKIVMDADPLCLSSRDGEGKTVLHYETKQEVKNLLITALLEYCSAFVHFRDDDLGLE